MGGSIMYRIGKEEIEAVARVIESRELFRINDGLKEADHFEEELAQTIGTKYALCVSGGTGALIAALAGLEIGPGDEVIVPAYTFMATATAVLAVGAIPVIAEIDDTLTIDPADVEKKITKYTKAIIPVHIVGYPSNMDKIMELARKYKLKVVEDACQADGGSYKGKRLGSIGDAGAFSFNHYKIISAGEGGAVVTDSKRVYERALVYHDGGSNFRPYTEGLEIPVFIGAQYRVSEITGAVLRVQLKRLDGILSDLRKVKKTVMDALKVENGLCFVRSNDIEGDCGTTLGFKFEDEETARRFADDEGVDGWLPIDSGKHIYYNWSPILEKRGGHNIHVNPFEMPQNKGLNMNYTKEMCPATLDILRKTVFIPLNPDWNDEKLSSVIDSCRKAVKGL
jgi:dTDP-4-amino-4,6-dideoxygalactose transaminase